MPIQNHSDDEIAERAYQLWIERGSPHGSHEEDWLEAEHQLNDATVSRRLTKINDEKGGSVQS
jgi:hypothetical protein